MTRCNYKHGLRILCLFACVAIVYNIILDGLSYVYNKIKGPIIVHGCLNTELNISTLPVFRSERITEWLDISEGRNHSDYGDNNCPDNPRRAILKDLLKRWIQLAHNNNISYMLYAGTLLGAWRNEDIMPYDPDMDIFIDRREGVKVETIASKEMFFGLKDQFRLSLQVDWRCPYTQRRRVSCRGWVSPISIDKCSFQEPLARLIGNGHYLDIYDYYEENGTIYDLPEFEKKYPAKTMYPLKKCRFMGMETYCPNNPKVMLKKLYGKYLHPTTKCKNGKWVKVG